MSTPTPRTDSLAAKDFVPDGLWIAHSRTLERELATEREKSERYRLASLKLDAELATERARLDWLESNAGDIPKYNSRSFIWFANQNIRAAIDAAMKEGTK